MQQDKPFITVAMAVYNGERYLRQAIENILCQSYSDYELLLIDDGSTDGSPSIMEHYAQRDNRIKVIYKERNEGLSSVRNLSIAQARGEYLLMIDADDLFEADALEIAATEASRTKADVIIWDYDIFFGDKLPIPGPSNHLKDITANQRDRLLFYAAFMHVRLIRTEYAREKGLTFSLGLTKQDIPVHWQIMTDEGNKISLIRRALLHYRQHQSATSARKGKSLFDLATVMDIVGENLRNGGIYSKYQDVYLTKRLSLLHGMYDFIVAELKAEALDKIRQRLDADAEVFIRTKAHLLPHRVRLFYQGLLGNGISRWQYRAIMSLRKMYRLCRNRR